MTDLMRRLIAPAFIALGLWLPAATAGAGEFTLVSMLYSEAHPVPHIHYEGGVEAGDPARLAQIYERFVRCRTDCIPEGGGSTAVLTMHSDGGVYRAGLDMADFIRNNRIATVVEDGMACYSACAFAFLGGTAYSRLETVGDYVDRVVEPGGVLGFHAPYFDDTDFREAVMASGSFAVQTWSRNDFSLMVNELVRFNVNPLIMSVLVGMGPSDFYYVATGADYYMMRIALPPTPARHWQADVPSAIRNACVRLIALFDNTSPHLVDLLLTERYEEAVGTAEMRGDIETVSGYRLTDSNFGVGFCGATSSAIASGGDLDVSIFTTPGPFGYSLGMYHMYSRQDGWSSAGLGGVAAGRVFQKGPLSHYYTPLTARIVDLAEPARLAMRQLRFNTIVTPPLPTVGVPLTLENGGRTARVSRSGDLWVIEQVGLANLVETAAANLGMRGTRLDYDVSGPTGFVREGTYGDGTAFGATGLVEGGGSALVTAMIVKPPGEAPSAAERALLRQVLCTARFGTMVNAC